MEQEQAQANEQKQAESKPVIGVIYAGSGVKTLNGFGTFFFILAGISLFTCFITLAAELYPIALYLVANGIFCLLFGAISKGLSSIAKTALYKRALLEKQYEFKEFVYQ